MKFFQIIFSFVFIGLLMSCGNSKDLQKRSPAQFQQAYYNSNSEGLNLYLPVAVIQNNRLELDSIYFRGMRSELQQDDERKNLFTAHFAIGEADKVMHVDPREESANKAPQKPQKSPFPIADDEAVLVFTQNGKTKYYKIEGIAKEN